QHAAARAGVAARRARGAGLDLQPLAPAPVYSGGPETAPTPPTYEAPRESPGRLIVMVGAPKRPPHPQRTKRPGNPARLIVMVEAPKRRPHPPTFVAPRETRGAS